MMLPVILIQAHGKGENDARAKAGNREGQNKDQNDLPPAPQHVYASLSNGGQPVFAS